MHVFVTGATGFIGSAVVRELLAAGHRVTGFARSPQGAARLAEMGAGVHHGDLTDPESLRRGATAADGVVHTGFNHDFSRFRDSCEEDRHAILALGAALKGSARPLVVTSGIGILPQGALLTEDTVPATGGAAHPRAASEAAADELAAQGVRISVLRLPPSVHGKGDHGFVPMLIDIARRTGVSAFVGTGENRWPAVHRLDAARAFRLALEAGEAGRRYHEVAEEGVAFSRIAEAIGKGLGLPVVSAAAEHFGWFSHFAAMDVPADSRATRAALGWQPREPGLLDDIATAGYFSA